MRTYDSIPVLEPFESRLLLSSQAALSDVFTTAAPLTFKPVDSITLDAQLAQDVGSYYQFTIPANGSLKIAMNADGSQIAPQLTLYNADGKKVRLSYDLTGGQSTLSLHAYAGRTYYLQASDRNNAGGAVSLQLTSTPTDDYGNTFDTSRQLQVSSKGNSRADGRVNYGGDADVFSILADRSGLMTVSMIARPASPLLDPEISIYDAIGNLVARQDSGVGGASAKVELSVITGQTYYIRVEGLNDSQGRYVLSSHLEPPPSAPPPLVVAPTPPAIDGIAPGETIAGQILSTDDGLQLLILGTDNADTITLSQTTAGISLITTAGTQNFEGTFTDIVVHGLGGDDTIRLTTSITVPSYLYGDDGNNKIFYAGAAPAYLQGGSGDNLLVSIGAGLSTLVGGTGTDSFWADAKDTVLNVSPEELAVGAVHKISAFRQPYSTHPSSSEYVPLTINGQELADPAITSAATGYRNFSSQPLFLDGPQYNDIAQGQVSDCYFLAMLSSLADTDPQLIRQAIAPLGDGTYAVRFYQNGQSVYYRIDSDLPVSTGSSLAYAKASDTGEIWVPLLEKAYAFFRKGLNSYASLKGGWMNEAYVAVTGVSTTNRSAASSDIVAFLTSSLNAGHAVTVGTKALVAEPIIASHAYVIRSVDYNNGNSYVTLYNPWGFDGGAFDSQPGDGLLILSIPQFQQNFSTVMVCQA